MIFCCKGWGDWLVYLAWAFWWFDALVSMATAISMPFIVMLYHKPGLEKTTAALLLPIVPAVVAAATGGIVAEALPDNGHAVTTLVASYVLWGIGQALSACVLALYFQRLTVHSLPPKEVIVSVFLPVGPLGQGGFGIQQLGKVALKVIPKTGVFQAAGIDPTRGAETLYVLGVFLGMVMWGFALVWVCFALISLANTQHFPFNMGWWGFTFPLGVWATCTSGLATNLDSEFFKVATTVRPPLSVFFCTWNLFTVSLTKFVADHLFGSSYSVDHGCRPNGTDGLHGRDVRCPLLERFERKARDAEQWQLDVAASSVTLQNRVLLVEVHVALLQQVAYSLVALVVVLDRSCIAYHICHLT